MEIDDYLMQFEPAGPRAELRARILRSARPRRRWPILTAAAVAVAALWLVNVHVQRSLESTLLRGVARAGAERGARPDVTVLSHVRSLRKEIP